MNLLKRIRNLWKLSGVDINPNTIHEKVSVIDEEFNINYKPAEIIKMNDPLEKVLKKEEE